MIITKEIINNRVTVIKSSELHKEELDNEEYLNTDFDRKHSFKIIDNDGIIYLLIEVCRCDIQVSGIPCHNYGCYIQKIVVEDKFIDTDEFVHFINDFLESLYAEDCNGFSNEPCYKYLWAYCLTGDELYLVRHIGLQKVEENSCMAIYHSMPVLKKHLIK